MVSDILTNREMFHRATETAIRGELLGLDDEGLSWQLFYSVGLAPSAMLKAFAHRCAVDKIQYPHEPTPDALCTWFGEKVVGRYKNGGEKVFEVTNRELFNRFVISVLETLRNANEKILINTMLNPATVANVMFLDFLDACDKVGHKYPVFINDENLHKWLNERKMIVEED